MLLIIFSCNNEKLQSLNIKKSDDFKWNTKESCSIIFSNSENSDTLSGKIKYRGNTSSKYPKHSFSLELDRKYSFPNLPHDDDWILNASYIDKTFMRHKICYDIFREMSFKNVAPKCDYINVKVNDKYEGLYILMEEINGGMLNLIKHDTMAMLFTAPPFLRKERLPNKYVQDPLNYYQQKYPKIGVSDKTYYIQNFRDFIFHSTDNEFAQNISNWVDIENVIDWHILLLFSNNSDGLMKNFYLYKLDKFTPFRFAIWDYDHSFGRDADNELNLMKRPIECNESIFLERLTKISETGYSLKLKNRWFELREKKIISISNFERHITENNKIIEGQVEKNFDKWKINSAWYYDDSDYDQEVNLMRNFVPIRIKQLDDYFNYN